MEHSVKMNKKGQASIEFIMLISISMVYISMIVLPSVDLSRTAADDVTQLAQIRFATEKIANTIDSVAASGAGAKQTMTVFVPERGKIVCNGANKKITMYFLLTKDNSNTLLQNPSCSTPGPSGTGTVCEKEFQTAATFDCSPLETVGEYNIAEPVAVTKTVVVEKTGAVIDVTFS